MSQLVTNSLILLYICVPFLLPKIDNLSIYKIKLAGVLGKFSKKVDCSR